jgi:hypothetical protein
MMVLIEHDHVIEEITAAVTDKTLGHTVLPGTSNAIYLI